VSDLASFSTDERLRDGRRVEIRGLTPADQAGLVVALRQTSDQSLYRRFFVPRHSFTAAEIDFFVNVDFVSHVALVAVMQEGGRPAIVGGGRYIIEQPGQAELAFMVVDRYQGQGIGSALMRHLIAIARGAGLKELIAEVLADNAAMLSVFHKAGFHVTSRQFGIIYLALRLD
jgi:GNAT superfamily N-acetyltransferase